MRALERLFRRAALPLGMSQGFHPKPRMTLPSALALGIEGTDEVMELELAESTTADEVLARLAPHVPPGLSFTSAEILPPQGRKARVQSVRYRVPIPPPLQSGLAEKIRRLLDASTWPLQREAGRKPIDLRSQLEELVLDGGALTMRLRIDDGASARARDVLSVLGLDGLQSHGVHVTRTAVEIR